MLTRGLTLPRTERERESRRAVIRDGMTARLDSRSHAGRDVPGPYNFARGFERASAHEPIRPAGVAAADEGVTALAAAERDVEAEEHVVAAARDDDDAEPVGVA
jgi:hypothetical protein